MKIGTKIKNFKAEMSGKNDFNLADYSSNTILVPKIQEVPSSQLLECSFKFYFKFFNEKVNFKCEEKILKEIT